MKFVEKTKNSVLISIILIIVFGFFGVKALLHQGYFTSHDGWHQVVRLYYFDRLIKAGNFPPSYVKDLFYGYGYPLFIFNYHLPWMIAEPFMLLNFSVFDSIKAVYILGFILSGLTMFFYLRSRFQNFASFIGSAIYMWAPYRFSNIFVRGSAGEATVFIFLPLLFLAVDMLKKNFNRKGIFIGALSLSAIILSHAIVSLLVMGGMFLYLGIQIILHKQKIRYFFRCLLLIFIGLMLSAYYLVPALTLKSSTQFNERFQGKFDGHFATISELIYSKWGYGFSTPRGADSMSFQLGISQWLVLGLLSIYIFYRLLIVKKKIKELDFLIGFATIFIVSLLLILPDSKFFWEFLAKIFFSIDFPWRLLTLLVFSASSLSAYTLSLLGRKWQFVAGLFLLLVALYTNRNHLRVNQYTDIPLNLYLASEVTTNSYDEYLPKDANSDEIKKINRGGTIVSKNESQITGVESRTNSLAFNYKSDLANDFTIHLFYFPGWEVFVDNKRIDILKGDLGLINFSAPPGSHRVLIKYSGTTLARLSNFISLITMIILIFGFFICSYGPKTKKQKYFN